MRFKVKREIERLKKLNIIRRVDEPTEWVNSMVVVPKPNGEVRICLDPRDLNFAVKRENYQMPTLNETTSQLTGAKYFTVLDGTAGYWNVPLSKEASILTTLSGSTREDHDKRLRAALTAARKFNSNKIQKCSSEVKLFGELITKDGQKPDPSKVAAIGNITSP